MPHTDIIQTHHEAGLQKKPLKPHLIVLQQLLWMQDFHVDAVGERLCKNGRMVWFFWLGHLKKRETISNQNPYQTLFPQLMLAKVSCAVDARVHSSVTTEKVTPPVTPHSNYTSWEFPGFDVAEGSIFPLMAWHSLKINNAITPQNGFSYGAVWRAGMDCICKTCFRAQICFCALQMCSWCQQLCVDDITALWKTRSGWHR